MKGKEIIFVDHKIDANKICISGVFPFVPSWYLFNKIFTLSKKKLVYQSTGLNYVDHLFFFGGGAMRLCFLVFRCVESDILFLDKQLLVDMNFS